MNNNGDLENILEENDEKNSRRTAEDDQEQELIDILQDTDETQTRFS